MINELHNQGSGLQPANSLTGTRSFADPTTDTISFTSDVRIAVVDDTGAIAAIYDLPAGSYTIQAIETAIDTNLAGFATASTAADGPLTITASTAGYGIAVVDLAANTVTDIDAVTTYNGFSNYFGLNDLFVTTGNSPGDANTGISAIIEVRSVRFGIMRRAFSIIFRNWSPFDPRFIRLSTGPLACCRGMSRYLQIFSCPARVSSRGSLRRLG